MRKEKKEWIITISIGLVVLLLGGYGLYVYQQSLKPKDVDLNNSEHIHGAIEEVKDKDVEVVEKLDVSEDKEVVGSVLDREDEKGNPIKINPEDIVQAKEDAYVEEKPTEQPDPNINPGEIIDNSIYPDPSVNDRLVIIGPTTGNMGSKVNPNDPSGVKLELSKKVNDEVAKIKHDPNRISDEYKMMYYPETEAKKKGANRINERLDAIARGEHVDNLNLIIDANGTQSFITTYYEFKIETEYDNVEGIINEMKIHEPEFLMATFTPDNPIYGYDLGTVRIYFDKEKGKNIVMMALFNVI